MVFNMEIKFSARFIKLTFDIEEEFSGRSLKMAGEPLDNGFDADTNSMIWLEPFDTEEIDESTKNRIKQLIIDRNKTHSFKVLFIGDDYV